MEVRLHLAGPAQTEALGYFWGRRLGPGDLVVLIGPLGAGKTCLTQGLARGLDTPEDEPVVSPSYTLVNEYQGRVPLYHLDLYRIDEDEFFETGLDEYFHRPGVCVLEWGDKIRAALPEPRLEIELKPGDPDGRTALVRSVGPDFEDFVSRLSDPAEIETS